MKNFILNSIREIDIFIIFEKIIHSILFHPLTWSASIGLTWGIITLFGIGELNTVWNVGNITFAIIAGTLGLLAMCAPFAGEWKYGFKALVKLVGSWVLYIAGILMIYFLFGKELDLGPIQNVWIPVGSMTGLYVIILVIIMTGISKSGMMMD